MKKFSSAFLMTVALSFSVSSSVQATWDESTFNVVVQSLNVFWEAFLGSYDVEYQHPAVYAYTDAKSAPCRTLPVAHYCLTTNTIYLDMIALNSLADSIGDSAAYWVIAHEYSHSVQYHLGLFSSETSAIALELQADCLAGTFFAAANYAGILEPGDFEEGFFTAFIFGDSAIEDPAHYGSPAQRAYAFASGFSDPSYCFSAT